MRLPLGPRRRRPGGGAALLAATALAALCAAGLAALAEPDAPAVPARESAPRNFGVVQAEQGLLLVGEVERTDIVAMFPAWAETAAAYAPDAASVAELAAVDVPVDIVCVLGTWCSDSQREVPRFWRILDLAANPHLKLRLLAVGRKDDAAALDESEAVGCPRDIRVAHGVTLVPTFIFSAGGTELGRIVETPTGTLEGDAAAVLADAITPRADSGGWR